MGQAKNHAFCRQRELAEGLDFRENVRGTFSLMSDNATIHHNPAASCRNPAIGRTAS